MPRLPGSRLIPCPKHWSAMRSVTVVMPVMLRFLLSDRLLFPHRRWHDTDGGIEN
jgi:hypothetical protein